MVGTESIKADLVVLVPKHTPADVVANSGIVDQSGRLPADKYTLEIQGGPGVECGIGDTTNLAVLEVGAVAHFQSEVVASWVYEDIALGHADTKYTGRVICFIMTGLEEATQVLWNYERPAMYPPPASRFFARLKDMTNYSIWGVMRCGL